MHLGNNFDYILQIDILGLGESWLVSSILFVHGSGNLPLFDVQNESIPVNYSRKLRIWMKNEPYNENCLSIFLNKQLVNSIFLGSVALLHLFIILGFSILYTIKILTFYVVWIDDIIRNKIFHDFESVLWSQIIN